MAGNTARDYSEELGEARSQSNENLSNVSQLQSPGQFNVPQHGHADSHAGAPAEGTADNYTQDSRDGNDHTNRLAAAREAAKIAKNVAGVAAGSPKAILSLSKNVFSLWKQVDFLGDIPYVAALGAAILKDLLDLATSITVILPILFSILCSVFIFMMLLLVGATGKKKGASKIFRKIGVLAIGGVADSIPGVGFVPIETITVATLYVMELLERSISRQGQKENSNGKDE